MILSRREARRIHEGRKCQHRLPRERRAPAPDRVVPVRFREPNPALGYDNSGEPKLDLVRVCHVKITERTATRVRTATAQDIEDEGYGSFDEFRAAWPMEAEMVWVIRFELEHVEMPRLLSNRIVAGKQGGYVGNRARALEHEMEAVDHFTQERFSEEGRERDLVREMERRDARDQLPFDLRLRVCETEARRRHIDIRSELRAIRRWTDPEAREKQLWKIQTKLDQPIAVRAAGMLPASSLD